MEVKIINNDNVDLNSIDDTAIRVKALILNSNNEILLGYSTTDLMPLQTIL